MVILRNLSLLVALTLSAASSYNAHAGGSYPAGFLYLKSITPGEHSALSAECDGTITSPELTCRFSQIMLSYKLDPKSLSEEIKKRIAQARAEVAKSPTKYADEACAEMKKSRNQMDAKIAATVNQSAKSLLESFRAFCDRPTVEGLESFVRQTAVNDSKTCIINTFQGDAITFKRVSNGKWVANVGPEGLCKSVYLYTMELEPNHENLWKWSQVRTYADTSAPLCKDTQLNYKIEYSWKGDDPDISCVLVRFGY